MAKANNKTAVFLNMVVLMLSLLLFISVAESRIFAGKAKSSPECEAVIGVRSGDTCFAITQTFNMTTEFFNSINPNLNCDTMFVGQWLCVAGTLN